MKPQDLKKIFSFHIKIDDLLPASDAEKKQSQMMKEGSTFLKDGLKRLKKNKIAMTCIVVLLVIILSVIFVPMFWPYSYEEQLGIKQGAAVDGSYANIKMFKYGTTELIQKAKYKNGLNLSEGPNGEVEYDISESAVVWRYVGETNWNDLITFYELAEANGYDKKKGDIEYSSTEKNKWVQWRYVSEEKEWDEVLDISKYSELENAINSSKTITYLINADTSSFAFSVPSDVEGEDDLIYDLISANDLPQELQKLINKESTIEYSIIEGKLCYREKITNIYQDLVKYTTIKSIEGKKVFPHIFGTDSAGRDYFIRVIYGARVSLSVGFFASIIVLIIGTIYGSISGYFGGKVDLIMMRIVDIIYSLPDMLIIILLSVVLNATLKGNLDNTIFASLGSNMLSIFIVFGLLYWVSMSRLIRGQILALREQEYVLAAKSVGAPSSWIIRKHLLPNCISVIIISTALQIPSAIFTESFLSFLGLGVSAPMPSLGSLASDALSGATSYTYRLLIPSIFICLIVLSLNLLGDGLRDAFDPKLKN